MNLQQLNMILSLASSLSFVSSQVLAKRSFRTFLIHWFSVSFWGMNRLVHVKVAVKHKSGSSPAIKAREADWSKDLHVLLHYMYRFNIKKHKIEYFWNLTQYSGSHTFWLVTASRKTSFSHYCEFQFHLWDISPLNYSHGLIWINIWFNNNFSTE